MKKLLCFLGTFICFLLCTFSVQADLIWEPADSFYKENASECTYVSRRFTANGPDGVVILYESPESPKVITTWENGYEAYISFTYEDKNGILWGVYDDVPIQTGWVPMEYMKVVYDHISFEEDYGGEIMEQSGTLEEQYREEDIYFWEYPGSEESYYSVSMTMPDLPEYSSVYTDEKGHSWGYIGYYYASRNFWICIDQPQADYDELYPDGGPQIGTQAEDAETEYHDPEKQAAERIVPEADYGTVITGIVLVVLVVLATVVLLMKLKKNLHF